MTSKPRQASSLRPRELGPNTRLLLLILSGVNLILGSVFFVYPTLIKPFWPWPVKELAVMFIGAIFLAITFGCWSTIKARYWQRGKVLPLVGAVFFGITTIVTLSQIPAQPSVSGVSWAWAAYFLLTTLGLSTILARYGWYRGRYDPVAHDPPWMLAKVFFRIQTVLVGVFGSIMLVFPAIAHDQFWPWKVQLPTLQTFAALFLATCLATGWASQQVDRERIRALLPLDAVFPTLALLAVGVNWNVIEDESPSGLVTAVWIFLYSLVAVGSTYLYFASRRQAQNTKNSPPNPSHHRIVESEKDK